MPNNIIFKHGVGSDFVFSTYDFFPLLEKDLEDTMLKTVGAITINAKNLYKPKFEVEFSSNIHFIALDEEASIQLEFIIIRKSQGFDEIVLGNRLYEITHTKSNFSQSFNFIYHDKDCLQGIYTYYIKTIPIIAKCCKVVVSNCNINAFAYSDYEYEIEDCNKEKILHLIEDLSNEEIIEVILNLQEDSDKVVKVIKEVKELIAKQGRIMFSVMDSVKEINKLINDVSNGFKEDKD